MNHMKPYLNNRLRPAFMRPAVRNALRLFILCLLVSAGQVCFGQTKAEIEKTERSILHAYYAAQDPHYGNAFAQLPNVQSALGNLKAGITAAQSAHPEQFAECMSVTGTAIKRADNAARSTEPVGQYGSILSLLSADLKETGGLTRVITVCGANLKVARGSDPAIEAAISRTIEEAINRLDSVLIAMDEEFQQIDEFKAEEKAKSGTERTAEKSGCENINLEDAGYSVRDKGSRIEDPFDFLRWVKNRNDSARTKIAALVDGKQFSYATAAGEALDIIEKENSLPDSNERVKISLEFVSVENCSDQKLNLVYRVYSTRIKPELSAAPESRETEKQSPQTVAGQTDADIPASRPVYFIPTGGYDSTNKLFGGGRLEITPNPNRTLPFKSVIVQGQGSSKLKTISAGLFGSTDPSASWLAHAEWLLDYGSYSLPTDEGQLKGGQLSAQFAGITREFQNFTFRFGGLLEGGNRQSTIRSVPLAPGTVANAGFGTLKLYAGLDSRLPHNVFSASYGLELGSIGPAARVDWRKHIGDLRHEFWYSLGDHHILDLESRFTVGRIQVPGRIPLSERFFGGNNEEFFIPGDSWQIRENPVIRAIPGSRFYRTANGAGGDRFFSYNLTAAYAVWRKPLVPTDLTNDPAFTSELQGAINTVTSTLQNYYASKDPNYLGVVAQLPDVQSKLDNLKTKVTASQTAHPGEFTAEFKACLKAVNGALRRVKSAIDPQGSDQYGLVESLLSDDPDEIQLTKVTQACARDLNTTLGDSTITTASAELENLRARTTGEFGKIDQKKAASKANADMVFTRRTLNTLFKEVNIYSVSPVFVLDVAKIGPERAGLGGLRYGPGAGIRLEFATLAHFTVGYAWNINQRPGEGSGTMFFSIGVRDLFH